MKSIDCVIHRLAFRAVVVLAGLAGACQPTGAPGSLHPGLDADQRALAEWGKVLFTKRWLESEGLGPYYNFAACSDCHALPVAGGHGDKQHLARNTTLHGDMTGLPFQAIRGRAPLQLPAGATAVFPVAPATYGLGLLEAIPDDELAKRCGNLPADGVKGVANFNPGRKRVARFGLKAHAVDLRDFVATALNLQMGLTNPFGRDPRHMKDDDAVLDPEVGAADVDAITAFVRALQPPSPPPQEPQAEALFAELGCAQCHRPETGNGARAYTDLCLHDLGPGLSNGMPDFLATGSMWRTPALWGLRWRDRYFHDGRTSELGATILAHDGEAKTARERYSKLDAARQQGLVRWLKTL